MTRDGMEEGWLGWERSGLGLGKVLGGELVGWEGGWCGRDTWDRSGLERVWLCRRICGNREGVIRMGVLELVWGGGDENEIREGRLVGREGEVGTGRSIDCPG